MGRYAATISQIETIGANLPQALFVCSRIILLLKVIHNKLPCPWREVVA